MKKLFFFFLYSIATSNAALLNGSFEEGQNFLGVPPTHWTFQGGTILRLAGAPYYIYDLSGPRLIDPELLAIDGVIIAKIHPNDTTALLQQTFSLDRAEQLDFSFFFALASSTETNVTGTVSIAFDSIPVFSRQLAADNVLTQSDWSVGTASFFAQAGTHTLAILLQTNSLIHTPMFYLDAVSIPEPTTSFLLCFAAAFLVYLTRRSSQKRKDTLQ